MRRKDFLIYLVLPCALLTSPFMLAQKPAVPPAREHAAKQNAKAAPAADIRSYIDHGWQTLSRSMTQCGSVADVKVAQTPVLYLPQGMAVPDAVKAMQQKCRVQVEHLPVKVEKIGDIKPEQIQQHGLLYLPNPYVVPGGRFNEMYGWDSYFIILGLLRDQHADAAKAMVENFFFEIENYGALLNANRTYFFTRSQPPLLTSMIMAVEEADPDRAWLERAYGFAVRDHDLWTREPHLAGNTGLSRYFDFGEGPVAETADDPHYFAEVASAMLKMQDQGREYLEFDGKDTTGPAFNYQVCAQQPLKGGGHSCGPRQQVALTRDYYKGDRSMRESGFDISFRFGPYSGSTHHYAPVCLNSLLYKAERDLAKMAGMLGKPDSGKWEQMAEARKAAMVPLMWNEKEGLFFDHDFVAGRQSEYRFASTFYPLWAGLATPEQARAVAAHVKIFERPGGVSSSDRATGMQWDEPYGWAPLQYFAVEGLRRYGNDDDADRLARAFTTMVEENYGRDGTIREKYNLVTRTTDAAVTSGYKSNVVGFGWTNGVYLVFADELSKAKKAAGNANSGGPSEKSEKVETKRVETKKVETKKVETKDAPQ